MCTSTSATSSWASAYQPSNRVILAKMDSMANSLGKLYRSVATSFMSLPTESHFLQSGTLTPEEFLLAGDQLVHRCPTWTWERSAANCAQAHLPPDKQFLITRGVPCRRRVKNTADPDIIERETDDGWVITEIPNTGESQEVQEITVSRPEEAKVEEPVNLDDIPDLQSMEAQDLRADPNAPQFSGKYFEAVEPEETILRTRVYDLSVTYDTYYQTPRLWLVGYDEVHNPLSPEQMFEDIMDDYAHKTVTIERHPCLGTSQASIHPCNHAKMMKKFIEILESNGSQAQVHQAMFVFLKFLSSVVPTIEYDFTMDLSLA